MVEQNPLIRRHVAVVWVRGKSIRKRRSIGKGCDSYGMSLRGKRDKKGETKERGVAGRHAAALTNFKGMEGSSRKR